MLTAPTLVDQFSSCQHVLVLACIFLNDGTAFQLLSFTQHILPATNVLISFELAGDCIRLLAHSFNSSRVCMLQNGVGGVGGCGLILLFVKIEKEESPGYMAKSAAELSGGCCFSIACTSPT